MSLVVSLSFLTLGYATAVGAHIKTTVTTYDDFSTLALYGRRRTRHASCLVGVRSQGTLRNALRHISHQVTLLTSQTISAVKTRLAFVSALEAMGDI